MRGVALILSWLPFRIIRSEISVLKFLCFFNKILRDALLFLQNNRSSHWSKKDVLRNFAKFTGKYLCQSREKKFVVNLYVYITQYYQITKRFKNQISVKGVLRSCSETVPGVKKFTNFTGKLHWHPAACNLTKNAENGVLEYLATFASVWYASPDQRSFILIQMGDSMNSSIGGRSSHHKVC